MEAPHLQLTLAQSDRDVVPGSRVSLIAEIELPPDTHVYSPGVRGYKAIQLKVHEAPGIELAPVTLPEFQESVLGSYSGACTGLRGKVSHCRGRNGGFRSDFGSRAIACIYGDDDSDYRGVEVSGLRQNGVLSADVSASHVEFEGLSPGPWAISRGHSA